LKTKPLVLFVEDNVEIIELLEEIAPSSPVRACFAKCSMEALALYKNAHTGFDAILVDRRLPDLHGDLLARELRLLGFKGLLACYSSDRIDTLDPHFDMSFQKAEPVFQVLRKLEGVLNARQYLENGRREENVQV
jgi:CheY-like chemotaxis protein